MKPDERITLETVGKCKTPIGLDHDEKYGVPSLEELGKNLNKVCRIVTSVFNLQIEKKKFVKWFVIVLLTNRLILFNNLFIN